MPGRVEATDMTLTGMEFWFSLNIKIMEKSFSIYFETLLSDQNIYTFFYSIY